MPTPTQENHPRRRPPPCLSRSQRNLLLFFLKCVVMLIAVSLFLFFLGFAAAVLLYFLFTSTASRRRRRPPPRLQTLLPDVLYSAAAADCSRPSDCAICLDCFEEGDLCRSIPICKHLFHARCLDRWIEKKPTCPVCRGRVDLGSTGSEMDGDDRWKRLWAVNIQEGTSY